MDRSESNAHHASYRRLALAIVKNVLYAAQQGDLYSRSWLLTDGAIWLDLCNIPVSIERLAEVADNRQPCQIKRTNPNGKKVTADPLPMQRPSQAVLESQKGRYKTPEIESVF